MSQQQIPEENPIQREITVRQCVPKLPKGMIRNNEVAGILLRPNESHYEGIYRVWNERDSTFGITKPLKDWGKSERNADKKTKNLYSIRKVFAEEINLCGGLQGFRQEYTEFVNLPYGKLRSEIQRRRKARKESQ